jgi:hypothetical protein
MVYPVLREYPVFERPMVQRFETFWKLSQAGVTTTGVTSDGNNWNPSSGSCGSRS